MVENEVFVHAEHSPTPYLLINVNQRAVAGRVVHRGVRSHRIIPALALFIFYAVFGSWRQGREPSKIGKLPF